MEKIETEGFEKLVQKFHCFSKLLLAKISFLFHIKKKNLNLCTIS